MATYVLIAGGGWGGFIWRPVASLLRAQGQDVFTPTLTGLGERVHLAAPEIGLNTHVQDILGVLDYEDLHEVILVGHSYAGMVITGVAERVPQRLAHLVYLDALVPQDGQSALDVAGPAMRNRFEARAHARGEGWRIQPPSGASSKMTAHPFKSLIEPLALRNSTAAGLPRTFVSCTQSGVEVLERVATRVRAEGWHVYEVDAGHMAMVTASHAVVAVLLEVAHGASATPPHPIG